MFGLQSLLPALSSVWAIPLLFLAVIAVLYAVEVTFFSIPYPSGVPLIREPPGAKRFSIKTRLAYYTDCQKLYEEAWELYAKKGRAVIIPTHGYRDVVFMPPSSMSWAVKQPETRLGATIQAADNTEAQYSIGHEKYVADSWVGSVVRSEMNTALSGISTAMQDELHVAFDKHLGFEKDEWKEVDIATLSRNVVAEAASRFVVGLPLCRNDEYLKLAIQMSDSCIVSVGIVGIFPAVLRPVVGRLMLYVMKRKMTKLKHMFQPLFQERLALCQKHPDIKSSPDADPEDLIQMMMRHAQKHRPDEFASLDEMARRLSVINFGSMHQTALQLTNLLLNLIGSDAEFNTISVLRDEFARVTRADDFSWSRADAARMIRADSIAKETLRLYSFGPRAVSRKVMVDGLLTDQGLGLPRGTSITFLGWSPQPGTGVVDRPLDFDPFRFSRIRESQSEAEKEAVKPMTFVSTGPEYLAFGHGRHACPGRYLIDFEMKMIMEHLLRNFDVKFPDEYGGKRPQNVWQAETIVPPRGAKMMVRRRATPAF